MDPVQYQILVELRKHYQHKLQKILFYIQFLVLHQKPILHRPQKPRFFIPLMELLMKEKLILMMVLEQFLSLELLQLRNLQIHLLLESLDLYRTQLTIHMILATLKNLPAIIKIPPSLSLLQIHQKIQFFSTSTDLHKQKKEQFILMVDLVPRISTVHIPISREVTQNLELGQYLHLHLVLKKILILMLVPEVFLQFLEVPNHILHRHQKAQFFFKFLVLQQLELNLSIYMLELEIFKFLDLHRPENLQFTQQVVLEQSLFLENWFIQILSLFRLQLVLVHLPLSEIQIIHSQRDIRKHLELFLVYLVGWNHTQELHILALELSIFPTLMLLLLTIHTKFQELMSLSFNYDK